jgi:hypothetical protein
MKVGPARSQVGGSNGHLPEGVRRPVAVTKRPKAVVSKICASRDVSIICHHLPEARRWLSL